MIASGGYVGIFGEMPASEPIDFDYDIKRAHRLILDFYQAKGYDLISIQPQPQSDEAEIKILANGKGKNITFMYNVTCSKEDEVYNRHNRDHRFIILTRWRGGEFEVINEGENKEFTDIILGRIRGIPDGFPGAFSGASYVLSSGLFGRLDGLVKEMATEKAEEKN